MKRECDLLSFDDPNITSVVDCTFIYVINFHQTPALPTLFLGGLVGVDGVSFNPPPMTWTMNHRLLVI